jgi:hypothetical protein
MARVLGEAMAEPREARRAERQAFARTFSWDRTGDRACSVLEQHIKQGRTHIHRLRRLAWVTALSSGPNALSEPERALLQALSQEYTIELIDVHGQIELPDDLLREYLILSTQEASERHAAMPYDLFLYHLHPLPHPVMLGLLRRFPGLAVLLDFQEKDLTNLARCKLPPDTEFSVDSSAVWSHARRCLNADVVYLPLQGAPQRLKAYAGWIELSIRRRVRRDSAWRTLAVQSLAEIKDDTQKVIESWATLRVLGQLLVAQQQQPKRTMLELSQTTQGIAARVGALNSILA